MKRLAVICWIACSTPASPPDHVPVPRSPPAAISPPTAPTPVVTPREPAPAPTVRTPRILAISANDTHACALSDDSTVTCWGQNSGGELGRPGGSFNDQPPGPVDGITDAVQVATGAYKTCVLARDGSVACFGYLEDGDYYTGAGRVTSAVPVHIAGLLQVTQIAVGDTHMCALRVGGTVVCWGTNASGQLGDGTTREHYRPAPVKGLTDVVEIAAKRLYSCARKRDGTAWCWGQNYFGALGDGTRTDRAVPTRVSRLDHVTRLVAVGEGWNCAERSDGTLWCWGTEVTGVVQRTATPLHMPGFDGARRTTGDGTTMCGIAPEGHVICVGRFEVPGSFESTYVDAPVALPGTDGAACLASRFGRPLTLDADGTVRLWTYGEPFTAQTIIDRAGHR